jgi:Glyoxalase-like domain
VSQLPVRRGGAPVFDHLMHWVPDLPAAVTAYQTAGFPLRTNRPRAETGVHNGGWWKNLHYVEVLAVVDPQRARTTAYGGFTPMILPAVERTLGPAAVP